MFKDKDYSVPNLPRHGTTTHNFLMLTARAIACRWPLPRVVHGDSTSWRQPWHPLQPQPSGVRCMGGGQRNAEHTARYRKLRRERKKAFRGIAPPPKPPKVIRTDMFDSLIEWKDRPIPDRISAPLLTHIEDFIKTMWLIAYPCGANLRKLQRDIAFRMPSQYRPEQKLPYQVIMTIIGKLEREGYLKSRMSGDGHCLVYRDDDCIQFDNPYIVKHKIIVESGLGAGEKVSSTACGSDALPDVISTKSTANSTEQLCQSRGHERGPVIR